MPNPLNNATSWILAVFESDLPAPAKLTCAALRTFLNDHTEMAWPAVGRLARMTSQCERTIQNHLKLLCDRGFLIQNGFSQVGTKRYVISLEGVQEIHPPVRHAPRKRCTPPQEVPVGGAGDAPELTKRTKKNGRKFKPPSLDEVIRRVKEMGYSHVDPSVFWHHYEGNGWKVGKNRMADWHKALGGWEARNKPSEPKERFH